MYHIAIIGNSNYNKYFNQVIEEYNLHMPNLKYKYFNKYSHDFLKNLSAEQSTIDVLLCGPADEKIIGPVIKESTPIISIQPRLNDILYACIKSANIDNKICILSPYSLSQLTNIIPIIRADLNINIKMYSSSNTVEHCIKEIVEEGFKSVIGGFGACYTVEKYHIKSFLYYTKECIVEYIKNAIQIISAIQHVHETQINLQTIIDVGDIGMILVENNFIKYLNAPAEKILGLRGNEIFGQNINNVLSFTNESEDSITKIASINDNDILLQCALLSKGQTVYRLQEIQSVEKASDTVRTQAYKKHNTAKYTFFDIIGKNIKSTIDIAKSFAKSSDASILIMGQTGTGKELFASSIHNYSNRYQENFVAINCAALPETLLESELFGYEPGAFTGAKKQGKRGLIELAHKGTLFLDEISELPLALQAKLLRVIQEREIMHIGGDELIPIDIRIIAATNRNLLSEVQNSCFRSDLYYRLSTLILRIPSLYERDKDYMELTNFFLKNRVLPAQYKNTIKDVINNYFFNYSWPGNIRELQNVIERAITYISYHLATNIEPTVLMNDFKKFLYFEEENLPVGSKQSKSSISENTISKKQVTQKEIKKVLEQCGGNRTLTAKLLGISRTTLWRKLKNKV